MRYIIVQKEVHRYLVEGKDAQDAYENYVMGEHIVHEAFVGDDGDPQIIDGNGEPCDDKVQKYGWRKLSDRIKTLK